MFSVTKNSVVIFLSKTATKCPRTIESLDVMLVSYIGHVEPIIALSVKPLVPLFTRSILKKD